MNKILNFINKWATLGFDAMFIGTGVLMCKSGIDLFYRDHAEFTKK